MPVRSDQCKIGMEKYPINSIRLNYNDDEYSQAYGQIEEVFIALTKDNILQPYITEDDFRSSNDGDDIVYSIHSFDTRYQKSFESDESVKVEFKYDGVVPAGIYGNALILTNRLVSKVSDG